MDLYDLGYGTSLASIFAAATGLILFIGFFALAIVLLLYILRSLGFMTMARNRGIANPWLIWIPYVGEYTFGAVVDDINAKQGKTSYFRYILLGGGILNFLFIFLSTGRFKSLVMLAIYILSVICLNIIFKSYKPESATTWTVLCAIPFTAVVQSIFPYVLRNNRPTETSTQGNLYTMGGQTQQGGHAYQNPNGNGPYQR